MKKCIKKESKSRSPPQQKPAAPTADTPFFFKAAITGLASSYPLSYKEISLLYSEKGSL